MIGSPVRSARAPRTAHRAAVSTVSDRLPARPCADRRPESGASGYCPRITCAMMPVAIATSR